MMKRLIVAYVLCGFFALYFTSIFANLISPRLQIFIDTEKYEETSSIQLFFFGSDIITLSSDENGFFSSEFFINSKRINVDFVYTNNTLSQFKIEDKLIPTNRIKRISQYTTCPSYAHTYCILTNFFTLKHIAVFVIIFLIIMPILVLIFHELRKTQNFIYKLIYSDSSLKAIGKKYIILSFIATILTLFLYCGCDLNVISETIIMFQNGIDIYQLFANLNKYKNVGLLMWQYDGAMLAGYGLYSYLFYPALSFFNPNTYHWIQIFEYKIFNMLLMNFLVLSIISYLLDTKLISPKKAKQIYLWSIFNPLTFYVCIWFIQFDILPAYLLILGILLLTNIKQNKFMAIFLISFSLATKMTMWLLFPAVALYILFILIKEKNVKFSFFIVIYLISLLSIFLLLPRFLSTPIQKALSNLEQSQRIWFTVIQYVPDVFLIISIFSLIVCFSVIYFETSLAVSINNIALMTIIAIGAITMAFSYSTLSTPSFYLQTTAAFVILYSMQKDNFSSMICALLGGLTVCTYMFFKEGDITASLLFLGKEPFFTKILQKMSESGNYSKYVSFFFTVSVSAMFVFMLIFINYANKFKKESNPFDQIGKTKNQILLEKSI